MNDASPDVTVSEDRRRIAVAWPDGRTVTAPAPWLYDNAEETRGVGGHRLRGAVALDAARQVLSARVDGGAIAVRFAAEETEQRVPLGALSPSPPDPAQRRLWTSAGEVEEALDIDFQAYLSDDAVLAEALGRVARDGVAFFSGAGAEPETVALAVARFGYIRETNYGRLFDVREEAVPTHLAYTAVGLELHTDNPYRDPVPTLQLLHVIDAAPDGGESQFADGFAHAEVLRDETPERFDVLARTPVEFAYASASGERYAARAPVIETGCDGAVRTVRLNHRALRTLPLGVAEAWYEAYLDFGRRLNAPEAKIGRKLAPGDMVMFDNRRVLHGRSAYRPSARGRWLEGCYAERDGLLATLARLSG